MRVVFTHRNQFDYLNDKNSISRLLLYLAAYSWKKVYPGDCVVLYGDQSTSEYVKAREYCFWDRVYTVDFEKVQSIYGVSPYFWAWPRVYTALLETEPCCIVDIDVLLLQPFREGLDGTKPWAFICSNDTERELRVLSRVPNLKRKFVGDFYYGGGLIYHPDPNQLHELSNWILNLDRDLDFCNSVQISGYGDTIITVEQSMAYRYYVDRRGYKTEEIIQENDLERAAKTPHAYYHAMDSKYCDQEQEKVEYIRTVISTLQLSNSFSKKLLKSLDFERSFIEKVI